MEYRLTDVPEEMAALGRRIAAEHATRYPAWMLHDFVEQYVEFLPADRLTEMFYGAVYCRQLYGSSLIEYAMYDFEHRPHAEKADYVTWCNRYLYMAFLNRKQDLHLLDDKYEAYQLLRPFYKREAMVVAGWEDYEAFCAFVERHASVFVKPVNLDLAEGVHRLRMDADADRRAVFASLLEEARALKSFMVTRPIDHRLILEEEIVQSEAMARVNAMDMSLLRVTTVLVKGRVHFFYPCFRMMCGDGVEQRGEMYSMDALIDAETGVLLTDGINACEVAECHPVSGIRIKGFQLPDWAALREMLEAAARMVPSLRYVGWDVAHSVRGWCIVEGNANGELCMSQMCAGHGLKAELEELIGFRVPFGFMLEEVERLMENTK